MSGIRFCPLKDQKYRNCGSGPGIMFLVLGTVEDNVNGSGVLALEKGLIIERKPFSLKTTFLGLPAGDAGSLSLTQPPAASSNDNRIRFAFITYVFVRSKSNGPSDRSL